MVIVKTIILREFFMGMTLDQALQKGIEAHKAGQVQEADKFYTAILQSQPKHPDANHNMGVLAVGIGKAQEALPFFKTAVEANPSLAQFWLSYIDALIRLNKNSDAAAALDQAKGKGIKGEAFDQLEQSINELDGSNRDTDLKKRPTGEASKIQDPPPEQLQSLINLYSQGQHQQALNQATEMLVQFPRSPTLYNICGAAHAGLGKLDAAIEDYKFAVQIRPDFAEAYNNMGNALMKNGDLQHSKEAFQKAMTMLPNWKILGLGSYFAYVRYPMPLSSTKFSELLLKEVSILIIPGAFFEPKNDLLASKDDKNFRLAFANIDKLSLFDLVNRLKSFESICYEKYCFHQKTSLEGLQTK